MKEESTRRGAMPDLVLTNKEGLLRPVKHKGSYDSSNHNMEFKIFRAARRMNSKLASPDFRQEDLYLIRDLLGRVPWDKAPEGRGTRER